MSFKVKILILCILVLLASIVVYKSIDVGPHKDPCLKLIIKIHKIIIKMDSFLKTFGIHGFQRGLENGFSSFQFYMLNRSLLNIEQREFDGVEVLIFDPITRDKDRPAIIHFHGGGWIYSNPKFSSNYLAELARRLNILIVSINYQKAPEHPFPAGVSDCVVATKYFLKNAEKFDVNPNRIALMGESAGGNLVVAVGYQLGALHKVDKGVRVPKIIIPIVPTLQMADLNTPSFRDDSRDEMLKKTEFMRMICLYAFGDLSRGDVADCMNVVSTNSHLNEEAVEKVRDNVDWKKYLSGHGGVASDYDKVAKSTFQFTRNQFSEKLSKLVMDPLFSPLSALNNTELGLLAPVYLIAASKDPLRDDAKLLAVRLAKGGYRGGLKEIDQSHGEFLLASFESDKFKEVFIHLLEILKEM